MWDFQKDSVGLVRWYGGLVFGPAHLVAIHKFEGAWFSQRAQQVEQIILMEFFEHWRFLFRI